jgi:hypothetical protein
MRDASRLIATAVGVLGVLCISAAVSAQTPQAVGRVATLPSGTIQGSVHDEAGAPVAGAMVSALGSSTAFAVSDRLGLFALRPLSPGPYLVRAHLSGFIAPRGQIVQVSPSARVSSLISLRHVATSSAPSPAILPASLGGAVPLPEPAGTQPDSPTVTGNGTSGADKNDKNDQNDKNDRDGEIEWRLRHARRSILNDAMDQVLVADASPAGAGAFAGRRAGRAAGSAAHVATSFFADTPFFGQVNLLTTSSFEAPQDLFAARAFLGRSVANILVGAPVGDRADWTVRGAVTQGDIASWVLFGDYVTRAPARHRYDVGVSYSTQRYDGGNFAALRNVTDGSRNAGTLHGFDTFAVTPVLSVTYGARYARYDYLDGQSLLSPRLALTVVPAEHLRVNALISRRALAPGAEEFIPPADTGIWLPPQRTFSSLTGNGPLIAERTTHVEAGLERDIAAGTTVSVRAFSQKVDNQLVTLFGIDEPGRPSATLGHYFVANGGGVDANGYGAGVKAVIAERVHGSIEYSFARARWNTPNTPNTANPADNFTYLLLLAPSALRTASERIHDLSTSIETDVPETSTRVIVLYRLNNGFARRDGTDRPAVDARFDVQVRQALPFMDFSTAKWEMLVAVRNFFHDASSDHSIYDELLVVRPPKRVVGGLTLRF